MLPELSCEICDRAASDQCTSGRIPLESVAALPWHTQKKVTKKS